MIFSLIIKGRIEYRKAKQNIRPALITKKDGRDGVQGEKI